MRRYVQPCRFKYISSQRAVSSLRNTPARIADCGWVRNALLTGIKPNESVVADRRMLGEERMEQRRVGCGRYPAGCSASSS